MTRHNVIQLRPVNAPAANESSIEESIETTQATAPAFMHWTLRYPRAASSLFMVAGFIAGFIVASR